MAEFQKKDNSIFKEVASKASIVSVISYELGSNAVIKKGSNYRCVCPFHDDHDPSMQIDVAKNQYRCFVDHNFGDPIDFVEKYEHISKFEALKKVCQICSIPLPEELSNVKTFVPQIEVQYKRELEALKELGLFYQTYLSSNDGKVCRDYLEKRKIPQDAIDHFQLGYAPMDPSLAIQALRNRGFEIPVLEKAGILANSSEWKDRFSNRLMYPIFDDWGHLVGFSGRKIREEDPLGKYINYPATALFNKGEILYHYHIAKNTCRKDRFLYVVEGFNDVIAFQRAGIESCVGTMGTALTKENLKSLKRLNVEIRLCLDKDEPGQIAEENCLPLLRNEGIPFMVVRPFKGGKDADEVLANFYPNGKDELLLESKRVYDPFLFLLARLLKKNGNGKTITDSKKINQFILDSKPYYDALDPVSKLNDLKALEKVTLLTSDSLEKLYSNLKEKKEEEPIGKPLKEEERVYPSRGRFRHSYPVKEEERVLVNVENLMDSKYRLSKNISLFIQDTLNTIAGKHMNPNLLKNEVQLIYVLPHSKQAAIEMESSGVNFSFLPFYYLNMWVTNIFLSHPSMESFSKEQYEILLRKLESYSSKSFLEKNEGDFDASIDLQDDAFSLDDLPGVEEEKKEEETYDMIFSLNINPDDIDFMKRAIGYISSADDSIYAKETFMNMLEVHQLLVQFSSREEFCRKNNLSLKLDKELCQLKIKMKKKGISF